MMIFLLMVLPLGGCQTMKTVTEGLQELNKSLAPLAVIKKGS